MLYCLAFKILLYVQANSDEVITYVSGVIDANSKIPSDSAPIGSGT